MNKTNKIIFFSPHFDDAIFSSAGLILNLLKKEYRVLVVTIFSGVPDYNNLSLFASKIICPSWVEDREMENRELLTSNKIEFVNLGFLDNIFRQNDLGQPVCLSWQDVFAVNTKKINLENNLYNNLKDKIITTINQGPCDAYFPLAIGFHFDHYLVNKIARDLAYPKTFYYEDLPYANNSLVADDIRNDYQVYKTIKINIDDKLSLVSKYKVGLRVGDNSLGVINDIKKYSLSVSSEAGYHERFWKTKT